MDEASYERTRAEEFRRTQSNQMQDRDLEVTFLHILKRYQIKIAYHFKETDYPEGVIEFHPEDVRQVRLESLENKKERMGTFRREITQNRPDLEFFSVAMIFLTLYALLIY